MESLNPKEIIPTVASFAIDSLNFVFERIKGGAWSDLAERCSPQADVIQLPISEDLPDVAA